MFSRFGLAEETVADKTGPQEARETAQQEPKETVEPKEAVEESKTEADEVSESPQKQKSLDDDVIKKAAPSPPAPKAPAPPMAPPTGPLGKLFGAKKQAPLRQVQFKAIRDPAVKNAIWSAESGSPNFEKLNKSDAEEVFNLFKVSNQKQAKVIGSKSNQISRRVQEDIRLERRENSGLKCFSGEKTSQIFYCLKGAIFSYRL